MQPQSISGPMPIRKECPPGACVCRRELLLDADENEQRILTLTQEQEKRLIERIGVVLHIQPGPREVRTTRGFIIGLEDRPGLCKKTRQAVPAAIRKCLEQHPEIAFAILDRHDLFGQDNGG